MAMTKINRTFFALSDPTRRDLMTRIARQPDVNVGQLAGNFQFSFNAISKHLRVLEQAGLVRRQKSGRENRFRISESGLDDVLHWIAQTRNFWTKRLDALETVVLRNKNKSAKKRKET